MMIVICSHIIIFFIYFFLNVNKIHEKKVLYILKDRK